MHFRLADHTIFLTLAGSRAYGTSTPASDVDVRGVCIAPRSVRLSYRKSFEQYQGAPDDRLRELMAHRLEHLGLQDAPLEDLAVYDLAKAVKLIADANPNMLELLFMPSDAILWWHPAWERFMDIRDSFLSSKAKHTFHGYAHAQWRKIVAHRSWLLTPPAKEPTRKDYGLPESSVLGADVRGELQKAVAEKVRGWGMDDILEGAAGDAVRLKMEDFWGETLGLASKDPAEVQAAVEDLAYASLGIPATTMELIRAERAYRSALRTWQSYLRWKAERNPARAELEAKYTYDTKHALHLIRLSRMCLEILRGEGVLVRRPDAEELLSIRAGALSFEAVEETFQRLGEQIEEASKTTKLPRAADHDKIDKVLVEVLT